LGERIIMMGINMKRKGIAPLVAERKKDPKKEKIILEVDIGASSVDKRRFGWGEGRKDVRRKGLRSLRRGGRADLGPPEGGFKAEESQYNPFY